MSGGPVMYPYVFNPRATKKTSRPPARRAFGKQYGPFPKQVSYSGENKFHDILLDDTIPSTGEVAETTSLNLIAQGVTESTRVGRKCTITSINMKGNLVKGTGSASATYNIALVLDKQANGALPNYTDVFETDTPFSHLNLANSQRFVILKRWYGTMNNLTVNGDTFNLWGEVRQPVSFNKKCNIPLEFSANTGAITEIRSNNLFVVWDSDVNNGITANLNFRLRFQDK